VGLTSCWDGEKKEGPSVVKKRRRGGGEKEGLFEGLSGRGNRRDAGLLSQGTSRSVEPLMGGGRASGERGEERRTFSIHE